MPDLEAFLEPAAHPRVIAHRGFSGKAPENTLAAIDAALEVGADMVEIDVSRTRDGHVVVLHDATLDRTTDGKGRLTETSFAEVRLLDAGSWFAERFAGEKIPTLAEVLDRVRRRIPLNVEIKSEAVTEEVEGGFVDRVVRLVRERGMQGEVILSSFSTEALRQARALAPEIARAVLYNRREHAGMTPREILDAVDARSFNLSAKEINAATVEACHAAGRSTAVYTVNDAETLRRMVELGVDAIFTDRPDRLLELIGGGRSGAKSRNPDQM